MLLYKKSAVNLAYKAFQHPQSPCQTVALTDIVNQAQAHPRVSGTGGKGKKTFATSQSTTPDHPADGTAKLICLLRPRRNGGARNATKNI